MASIPSGRWSYRNYGMQPQASSPPLCENRFFRGGNMVYKVKIRCCSSYRRKCFSQELENIIRTVLGNLNKLQPFSSIHFNIFPYKRRWRGATKGMCSQHERNLKVFPYVLIICLEEKKALFTSREDRDNSCFIKGGEEPEPCPPVLKPRRVDSPLEGAILQELMHDLEYESRVSVISKRHRRAREEVEESAKDVDKQKSASGPPSETQPEAQHSTNEEEFNEEGEDAAPGSETPTKPGLLTRLLSYIFPFSLLLVKEP